MNAPNSNDILEIVPLEARAQSHPNDYHNLVALSRLYYHAERHQEALDAAMKAEQCDPLISDFQNIQRAMRARSYETAKTIAHNMLEKIPGHPRAVFTLVHLLRASGAHEDCVEALEGALEISPATLVLRQNLIRACEDCGLFERAVDEARCLVRLQKDFSSVWVLMNVCLRYGFYEDVLEAGRELYQHTSVDSRKADIKLFMGHAHRILGARQEAIDNYKAAISHNTLNGAAWWALADMKNYKFSATDQNAMRTLAKNNAASVLQKCQALFALAKSHELDGELSTAMTLYKQANALHPAHRFDSETFTKVIDKIIVSFSEATLSNRGHKKAKSATPIFILGLPRSGSTLVEQILASHSQIEGTLEILALPSIKREAHRLCTQKYNGHYLDKVSELQSDEMTALGRGYLEKAAFFCKDNTHYFIDKLPHNFEHVGLIQKILPEAIIIDVRRNPMDCGYSLFKQYFSAGSGFSYNLEAIGAYYNGYIKLMDHWARVSPGSVYTLQYEDLIFDTATQVSALLEYIGVEFEPACLAFYENQRPVRTASSEQVRVPIYSKSIGAWRSIAIELNDLRESLGHETLNRFKPYTDLGPAAPF